MKTIEEIIVEKEFNELTQDELTMVAELAENEQEYGAMRSLFTQMNSDVIPETRFSASDATKQSLDNIFMAKHPVIAQDWKREEEPAEDDKIVPIYNKAWFRAAAVLLLFSGTSYYYLQNSDALTTNKENGRQVAMSSPTKADESTTSAHTSNFKTKDKSSAIAVPEAIPSNTETNRVSYDKRAEAEPVASDDAAVAYYFSNAPTSSAVSNPSKAKGLSADLYPNGVAFGTAVGNASGESVASADMMDEQAKDQSTSDVSTAEMLDWIQTVY